MLFTCLLVHHVHLQVYAFPSETPVIVQSVTNQKCFSGFHFGERSVRSTGHLPHSLSTPHELTPHPATCNAHYSSLRNSNLQSAFAKQELGNEEKLHKKREPISCKSIESPFLFTIHIHQNRSHATRSPFLKISPAIGLHSLKSDDK